jgi:hypothetical protein
VSVGSLGICFWVVVEEVTSARFACTVSIRRPVGHSQHVVHSYPYSRHLTKEGQSVIEPTSPLIETFVCDGQPFDLVRENRLSSWS